MKPKAPHDRSTKAAEARRLLNETVADLASGRTGSVVFDTSLSAGDTGTARVGLRRMWLFAVVLTLAKLEDILDEYKAVLPSHVLPERLELKKELVRRRVREFRNTVVAHYRDKETKRLLTNVEIQERFNVMRGDSLEAFQAWLDNVGKTCERIRDRLREKGP